MTTAPTLVSLSPAAVAVAVAAVAHLLCAAVFASLSVRRAAAATAATATTATPTAPQLLISPAFSLVAVSLLLLTRASFAVFVCVASFTLDHNGSDDYDDDTSAGFLQSSALLILLIETALLPAVVLLCFDWTHRIHGGPTRRIISKDALLTTLGRLLAVLLLCWNLWDFIVGSDVPTNLTWQWVDGTPVFIVSPDGVWPFWRDAVVAVPVIITGACLWARTGYFWLTLIQILLLIGQVRIAENPPTSPRPSSSLSSSPIATLLINVVLSIANSLNLLATELHVRANSEPITDSDHVARLLSDTTIHAWYGAIEIYDDGELRAPVFRSNDASIDITGDQSSPNASASSSLRGTPVRNDSIGRKKR